MNKQDDWKRALGLPNDKSTQGKRTENETVKMNLGVKILIGTSVLVTVLFIWGLSIERVCVAGNPDFENGTGFCGGNGRKDIQKRKQQEAIRIAKQKRQEELERAAKLRDEKENKEKTTFRTMTYICEASIKQRLREPSSYEHIDSTYFVSPKNNAKRGVMIRYRARNGFGGMNVAYAGCMSETGRAEDLRFTGSLE